MASSSTRPYQQHGVFFPAETTDADADPPLTSVEWPALPARLVQPSPRKKRRTAAEATGLHIAEKGFLLNKVLAEPGVLLVQSEADGKLYILKISQPGSDAEEGDVFFDDPLDLRVSTWDDAPGPLDDTAPFFNKLVYWQKLTREETDPIFALYFELVAEQLSLAIAYLRYGIRPDLSSPLSADDMPEGWEFRHHRDLAAHDVFINYLPTGRGRTRAAGMETNAFPQIVLGDFGNAGIEGDDEAALPGNIVAWGNLAPELRGWEDVHTLGRILRSLCMTHVPFAAGCNDHWSSRPDNMTLATANVHASAPPYSDQLIMLLQAFEWPDMTEGVIDDLADPAIDIEANERWVVDTLLPAAQAQVERYRRPRGGRPAGYYDHLSVAWTKPPTPGVLAYNPHYAGEAGNDTTGARPRPAEGDMSTVERDDRAVHQQLLRLGRRWDVVMPHEVRVVEWEAPTVADAEFPDAPTAP